MDFDLFNGKSATKKAQLYTSMLQPGFKDLATSHKLKYKPCYITRKGVWRLSRNQYKWISDKYIELLKNGGNPIII